MPKGVPNKKYSGKFKQMVVETMRREYLSFNQTQERFDIRGEDRVAALEQIYLEEGPEGLHDFLAAQGQVHSGQ